MGPCAWEVTPTCPDWNRYSEQQRADAIAVATLLLWAATGRRYGQCEVTVRPCNPPPPPRLYVTYPVTGDAVSGDGGGGYGPVLDGGRWFNRCGAGCSCSSRCEVLLDGPVTADAIVAVTVDGGVVPGSSYEMHDGNVLVRTDGLCWPSCADPATDQFQVTYLRGLPPPPALLAAAAMLACEVAAGGAGGPCRLPARMSSLTRQGVEVQVEQITDGTDPFVTGIPEVDRIVSALNPHRRHGPAVVLSPDLPTARRIM
ncbi:hypothetical protein [Micromonospora sp. WMMC273]|uniref:hypothetical protein n=1 Tax=Micromonospora sp. WMMC273 TaxID=3015157 RepID=UPI0022B66485|nr:hypothetical protein [Micromonospora sp. WMMC273]MCZ7478885.1 hypothetical protein [Micromonospora sp. WMMC273]